MGTLVVQCDRCGYSMRTVDCPIHHYALVVMKVTYGSPVYRAQRCFGKAGP